jgi:alginate O-acetyltransferase complex protein AlgI
MPTSSGSASTRARVILPLGISFITFQKIAFLIDVDAGRIESFHPAGLLLVRAFLSAAHRCPIVHYREMMPQFRGALCRFDEDNVSVGLTLFAFGLFEKLLLADSIAPFVTPIYERAISGSCIGLLSGWIAAVGFTLQIYFDNGA